MPDNSLNYVTSNLFIGRASDAGSFSARTPAHTNLQYHQIILVSSGALATGQYKVRFSVFEGNTQLEATVYSGKTMTFNGGRSAIATFAGQIKGIHLQLSQAFPAGQTVSCILSSSAMPFETVGGDVTDGAAPDTSAPLAGWRDLRMVVAGAPAGAAAPTPTAFGPTGNIKQSAFAIGDSVYLIGHIDHDIKVGSTMYLHAHWSTNGTNVRDVKWQLAHISAAGHNQANFGSDTVITLTEAAQGSAWRHMITEDGVGMPALEVDSLIIVELKRVTNGGTDNTDAVFGLFVDLHYEVQQYATPSRTPDFYTPP